MATHLSKGAHMRDIHRSSAVLGRSFDGGVV